MLAMTTKGVSSATRWGCGIGLDQRPGLRFDAPLDMFGGARTMIACRPWTSMLRYKLSRDLRFTLVTPGSTRSTLPAGRGFGVGSGGGTAEPLIENIMLPCDGDHSPVLSR